MPTEKEVYQYHADWYERLILAEDYQGNIEKEIAKIRDPKGLDIIEPRHRTLNARFGSEGKKLHCLRCLLAYANQSPGSSYEFQFSSPHSDGCGHAQDTAFLGISRCSNSGLEFLLPGRLGWRSLARGS